MSTRSGGNRGNTRAPARVREGGIRRYLPFGARAQGAQASAASAAGTSARQAAPAESTPQEMTITASGQTDRAIQSLFGGREGALPSHEDIATLTGALPGARVELRGTFMFSDEKRPILYANWTSHDGLITAKRQIVRDARGHLLLNNVDIGAEEQARGSAVGARILAREVKTAERLGVRRFEADANNPYVWARYGYRGRLVEAGEPTAQTMMPKLEAAIRAGRWTDRAGRTHAVDEPLRMAAARNDVTYFMDSPSARQWFKENASTGFRAHFDIHDKRSLSLLRGVLAEHGIAWEDA